MRMWLITENWPPRVGGIERYLSNLVAHLPGELTVVAPRVAATTEPGHIRVVRRRFFWPLVKPAWLPLFVSVRRAARARQIDVLLCGKALFEGLLGYYLKRHQRVPYVVFTYAMEIGVWALHAGTRRKLRRVLAEADSVVYLAEPMRSRLLTLGARPDRLLKLSPGVPDVFFDRDSDPGTLTRLRVRRPYILCVARLIPRKGVDVLIEAFARLDQLRFGEYQLVIVGAGPHERALKQLAERLLMSKSVIFLGAVTDADLRTLYAQAHLFALTPRPVGSDVEGFGMVYLEAAAAGLAALATSGSGAEEAVVHERTGIVVQPNSIEAVADALSRLLSDEALRQRLGAAASQRARQEFRFEQRAQVLLSHLTHPNKWREMGAGDQL